MKIPESQKSIENSIEPSIHLRRMKQMIADTIKLPNHMPAFPLQKHHSPDFRIYYSRTHLCLLASFASLNNIIDHSFAGFKFLHEWHFITYIYCFSLFLVIIQHYAFEIIHIGVCVLTHSFLPFCKKIPTQFPILWSKDICVIFLFSITNSATMNILLGMCVYLCV